MSKPKLHFIISAPRSGSTWLTAALNQHPKVFATEQRLFGNFCEMWPNNNGNLAPRITFDAYARAVAVHYQHGQTYASRDEFTGDFIREYLDFLVNFAARNTNCSVIVDKVTPYPGSASFVLKQIQKFVPEANVYSLQRDGRDVATSGTFDWLLKDGKDTVRYEYFVNQKPGTEMRRFFDDQVIAKWAQTWKESISAFKNFSPILAVKYESMKSNLAEVIQSIFDSLGVDSSKTVAEEAANAVTFEKVAGRQAGDMSPTAKERKGIVGDWKNFMTRHDGELFHSLAGDTLIAENYEPNSDWLDDLPESLAFKIPPAGEGATKR